MADPKTGLRLEVATPLGLALKVDCESVQAPSVQGEFGVLAGHLPLLAALRCGLLKYRTEGKDQIAAIGPGFVEAEPDRVLLLTDLFARPADIEVDAVKKELAAAEAALAKLEHTHDSPEHAEAQRNVDWAHARLECRAEADR